MDLYDGIYQIDYAGSEGGGLGGLCIMQGFVDGLVFGPMTVRGKIRCDAAGIATIDVVIVAMTDEELVTGAMSERGDRNSQQLVLTAEHFAGKAFSVTMKGGTAQVALTPLRRAHP